MIMSHNLIVCDYAIHEISYNSGGLFMQNEKKERRSFLKHILAGSAVLGWYSRCDKTGESGNSQAHRLKTDEILYHESEAFKKYYDSLR
jgi:hypothetical protein